MDIIWEHSRLLHIAWYIIMVGGIAYGIGLTIDLAIMAYKLRKTKKQVETIAKDYWFSLTLDDMYAKLNAGIEIKPSKYLK